MHHFWGDNWKYWDDIGKAVGRCQELAQEAGIGGSIKEKYGTLRWSATGNLAKYRAVYKTLIDEFPHITPEIIGDADWFKEHLVGLVSEADCIVDHEASYDSDGKSRWCAVCDKDLSDKMGLLRTGNCDIP